MRGPTKGYQRKCSPDAVTRIIAMIPTEEASEVDAWGVAAGMPTRTAAIRHLLRAGLRAQLAVAAATREPAEN